MKRALIAVSALAATSLVAVAGPAHAEPCDIFEDVTKPSYVTSSVSPRAVVVGKIKRTVTVSVTATDDCGVADISATLSIKGNSSKGSIFLWPFELTSGTPQNGTWTATEVLGDYETGGIYELSEIEIDDTAFNSITKLYAAGTVAIRHSGVNKLTKPPAKVKKNKKFTLKGNLDFDGVLDDRSSVKIQTKVPGKKWVTLKTVRTDFFGDWSTRIKVTKTKYYRAYHPQDNATIASTSKSYKVKKK